MASSIQKIRFTMTNPSLPEIVKAQFTVHGYSNNQRAFRLADASSAPDLTKTVTVVLDVKRNGQASSDLSLSRFTSVTSVDLDSLTYADGSTWQPASPGACSVALSMLMRLSATR